VNGYAMNSHIEPVPASSKREGVTIVVPCFNEEAGLLHLQRNLWAVRAQLQEYWVHFVLVDDGSTDDTWGLMSELFVNEPDVTTIRHVSNRGIGAAILTGIREARTEIVCSSDSDCSYDPRQLANMIPMLLSDVDLVTASPYHPLGQVITVPGWRLFFSKTASRLYRLVLKQKLHTYTSCFRVYRRTSILKLELRQHGFLGVAELIGKLDLQDSTIVECPAKLTSRIHGVSKMKTARVLIGHIRLLAELALARVRQTLLTSPPLISPRLRDL
jgi:glycosyltransferase involved in cell wall biosynthesis